MLISIITINLNNLTGLKKTISSVLNQFYNQIEFIIIDGLSNDGSKEYIVQNKSLFYAYISEKDNGIYHAMNKGIRLSTGDFVIFLNSGDTLDSPNILNEIPFNLLKDKLIFGRARLSNGKLYPNTDKIKYWLNYSLPNHQAMFFPKKFYKKNYFNENFKIVGDSEYKFRAFQDLDYFFTDLVICRFDLNGLSNNYYTYEAYKKILIESINASKMYKNTPYILYKCLIHTLKYLIFKLKNWFI